VVTMNKRGDISMSSLLDGDVVLSTGSGNVIVEQNGMRINILQQLQLVGKLASQLCWASPNSPIPLWSQPSSLPTHSWGVASVTVNRKIYVMGGTDGTSALNMMCIYDVDLNSWNCSKSLSDARAFPYAAASTDGLSLYIFGGFSIINGSDGVDNLSIEKFDIQSETWTKVSTNMSNSHHRGSSAVIGNEVFFFGSMDLTLSRNVSSYDMSSGSWKSFSQTMPVGRWNSAAVAVDNYIYVMGGTNDSMQLTERVDMFDISPLQQNWSRRSDLVLAVQSFCAVNVNGLVFVAGGFSPKIGNITSLVATFNPRQNVWRNGILNNLNYPRDSCSLSVVDGNIYTIGGRYYNVTPPIVPVGFIESAVPCF